MRRFAILGIALALAGSARAQEAGYPDPNRSVFEAYIAQQQRAREREEIERMRIDIDGIAMRQAQDEAFARVR
jgi:hypothetical protein